MAIHEPVADAEQLTPALAGIGESAASEAEAWRDVSVGAQVISYSVLVLMTVLLMFPFVWMVSTALRPSGYDFDTSLIPRPHVAFENFGLAWTYPDTMFPQYTVNSVIIAVVGTFLAVALNTLSGFAFSKFTFWGRDVLFLLVIATMMIPFQVIMIPVYVTLATLGLVNSYWGVILPSTASPFGIFLMRQFMQSIPNELLDAARIDGAGEYRIWLQVVVPIIRPALGALAIMQFLGAWNSFLGPLLIAQGQDMFTLPVAIRVVQGALMGGVQQWGAILLGADIGTVPILIVFLLATRQFISSLAVGAVKG